MIFSEKLQIIFVTHLPSDLIPYWDFDFDDGSTEPRDSSSAAIAACGMLEMAKYLEPEEAEKYTALAEKLIKALCDHCAVKDHSESNGLLLPRNLCQSQQGKSLYQPGVDECNTWGDYFFMEALTRLTADWKVYWY